MPLPAQHDKIDFRVYLGMILFRWQTIVVCFLYCLLGGVLYIQLAPKEYLSFCKIMIYRDPMLVLSNQGAMWRSASMRNYILESSKLRNRVKRQLMSEWGERVGDPGKMAGRAQAISLRPGSGAGDRAWT